MDGENSNMNRKKKRQKYWFLVSHCLWKYIKRSFFPNDLPFFKEYLGKENVISITYPKIKDWPKPF